VLIPAGTTQTTVTVTTLTDGIVEGDETLDINVSAVNSGSVGDTSDTGTGTIIDDDTPPAVENDEANATSGEAATVDVIGNDNSGTSELDPTTVQIIDPVNGEVTHYVVPGEGAWDVDPVTGEITFTPETGYVGDPTPIEYTVYDVDGNSGTGTVSINYGPQANNDVNDQAFEGETVVIDILGNDKKTSSPLDPMSVSLVAPANATDVVTDNEGDIVGFIVPGEGEWSVDEDTGAVTFVPDEDLVGYPTPVEYTVKEESGEESNRALIEVVYEEESSPAPTNAAIPVATDNLNIPVNSYNPIVIDVLANGDSFGAYGAGTVEISFTQPVYGDVALDDGGTPNDPTDDVIIYTPKADTNNVLDSFTYTITDAQGQTSTAKVSVNVQCTSSQSSDGGDAFNSVSVILMMFMTLLSGLYFVRKEEEKQGGL
jgi:CshA-type fibril repeat protein